MGAITATLIFKSPLQVYDDAKTSFLYDILCRGETRRRLPAFLSEKMVICKFLNGDIF